MKSKIDKFDGEYAFLSNFYPSIVYDFEGNTYPTVEHYFQAMKTLDPKVRKHIASAKTPGEAKRLGRRVELRSDWEDIKLKVMKHGLIQKFAEPELRNPLLRTGDAELIEGNWWGDTYWGVCNGVGENHLGQLLMEVREELR